MMSHINFRQIACYLFLVMKYLHCPMYLFHATKVLVTAQTTLCILPDPIP